MSTSIAATIEQALQELQLGARSAVTGTIRQVGDGIVFASGLSGAKMGEVVRFANGERGLVQNLEQDQVGLLVLGSFEGLAEGQRVESTGNMLTLPVGDGVLGRIISPLGEPLDGKGPITGETRVMDMERLAPGVIERQSVTVPLQTGLLAVDAAIPIGRGQRQLIIGDRGTGKTTVAIDTILNQQDQGVRCIYVAIGQKSSKIALLAQTLADAGALEHSVIVAASASDSVALQYLAPYAGAAIGEYFMDRGEDGLVVYDDLTKHAWAYRQLSLILRRPPGREAYPGDVFYLHSRLLERAARLSKEHGGGSLTALPIIETQAGDISAYIPTNVISITDGQIYLEADLFNAGIRPAVNMGNSVSRVGTSAQTKAMKKVGGKLKLDLAQYRELAAFAQFGSDLDARTKATLDRGARITELLKQPQNQPLSLAESVALLYAAINGYLDPLPLATIGAFRTSLLTTLRGVRRALLDTINADKILSDTSEATLKEAIDEVVAGFKGQA